MKNQDCARNHITDQSPKNRWSVMKVKVKVKFYKDLDTGIWVLLDVPVDSVLPYEGKRQGKVSVIQNQTEPNSNQAHRAAKL